MVNLKKGFTLIELLVVIAIIGILSSVVLASLNTARNKGADAAVKSNLNNVRAAAELFYDANNSSYGAAGTGSVTAAGVWTGGTGVCGSATAADGVTASIRGGVAAAANASGNAGACNVSATGWAAAVPLKGGGNWCVDSTGISASRTTALGTSTACPAS